MTQIIGSFKKDCVLFPPTILVKQKHKTKKGVHVHSANTENRGIYHHIWDLSNPLLGVTNYSHSEVSLALEE